MEEFKESQASKQDETRPVEVPDTEPETKPEPPKKKKKVLSEKQLEALKKGRERKEIQSHSIFPRKFLRPNLRKKFTFGLKKK